MLQLPDLLPREYLENMKKLLGAEYEDFLICMQKPPYRGIRWNPLKCSLNALKSALPFSIEQSPFSPLSFYADELTKPGSLAAHHAGMFYSQEPSAACAVTLLNPKPGDKVLDLCAAPGGKSTQAAALLNGRGLLWSNEIVKSRAVALLSNIERMGVRNAVVSSCHPQRLCEALSGFFDKVLVDAPCSGEGMFRREPSAAQEWTKESNTSCAQRQLAILNSAALAVKQGGELVYSTCTFSKAENEDVAQAFLKAHPDFEPADEELSFGRQAFCDFPARRIFPMDGGEGHFAVKFRRSGPAKCSVAYEKSVLSTREEAAVRAFYRDLFKDEVPGSIACFKDSLTALPEDCPQLKGLNVIRAGVELARKKGTRLEPSHAVFAAHTAAECVKSVDFSYDDPRLFAFLRGEETDCDLNGYVAVSVQGAVTGFGKASSGRLKNHYPKGLRMH